jgi:5'-AMP-activated protein kinase catalytic alpha subunit
MSEKDYLSIKNYEFKKDIGEGNFGKVKLGVFKKTGEEFAIKIINKDKIKQKMKNIIFKENEIITKFNHINIVYVFQIIEEEKNIYIIMEYCNKGELFDYIVAHQKLEEDEASIFFYQLINGVDYMHKKGVAHRDLKPENLLLTVNKILKIIDFGLSHEYDENSLLKTKCGSPSYAAPEIIRGKLYDGFKTDIWCCGIILYAMLCGYLPFEGDNNKELFRNILNCNPEYPSFMSKTAKKLIKSLLKANPDERLTIEQIKKNDFYLKGKELCKIDYNLVEDELEKRATFYGNEKNNVIKNNKKKEDEELLSKMSENNRNKKINLLNYFTDENNNEGINSFRQQILKNNDNFKKKIDIINDKIQKILQTDGKELNNKTSIHNDNDSSKRLNIFNYKSKNKEQLIGKQNIYDERFINKNAGHFLYLKKINKTSNNSNQNTACNSNSQSKTKRFFTQFASPNLLNKKMMSPFINEYIKNNLNNYKNTETINFSSKHNNNLSINNKSNDVKTLTINNNNCEKSPINDNIFNNIHLNFNKINKINSVDNKNRTKNYINNKNDYLTILINNRDNLSRNTVVNNINTIWKNNSDYKRKNIDNNSEGNKNFIIPRDNLLQIQNLLSKNNNNNSRNASIENRSSENEKKDLYDNQTYNKNKRKRNIINDILSLNSIENKDNANTINYRSKSRDNRKYIIRNLKESFNDNKNILPPLDMHIKLNH